jgi:hypothetical protein
MGENEKNAVPNPRPNESRRARGAKLSLDVIELYLKGLSGVNIKTHIKENSGITVSQKVVSKIINKEIAGWIKNKNDLIENLKAQELAKVNRLEFEYWEAWQRSCKQTTSTTTEKEKLDPKKQGIESATKKPKFDVSKISEYRKSNAGDPRFLDGIQWCVEMRCKLLGLDAMQNVPPPPSKDQGGTVVNIQQVVFTTRKVLEA